MNWWTLASWDRWPSWPSYPACGSSQGFMARVTLVLSLQPQYSFDFMGKELTMHSLRRLQASVLIIK